MNKQPYVAKTFTIPTLQDISIRTIEEHTKLYQGYVKHANLIIDQIATLGAAPESPENTYVISELQRRFGFEFDGMRNHEIYFASLEGGAAALPIQSALALAIIKQWGSVEVFLTRFKAVAMTRGIGWAMLSYDNRAEKITAAPNGESLVLSWVEEQHLGQLVGLTPILALDMWEHSYMLDYAPSEKKKYIEAFFANLNWNVIAENYAAAVATGNGGK